MVILPSLELTNECCKRRLKKLFLFYLTQSKSENCLLTSKNVEIEKKDEEKDFYFLKEVFANGMFA